MFATKVRILFGLILVFFGCSTIVAQVTIRVLETPQNTPQNDSIYLGGTFNNWNSKDPNMLLKRHSDGFYVLTFTPTVKYFEYKFTRGNWSNVEAGDNGNIISNRTFSYRGIPDTITANITSWTDLEILKITVTHTPTNTPANAPLYITGYFNQWNPADPKYKLERLENGDYQLILPKVDKLFFKFTRGSIESMEGNEHGKSNGMRYLTASNPEKSEFVIEGWEDISKRTHNYLEIMLIISAFAGFFIIICLNIIRKPKTKTNRILTALLMIISGMLVTKILLYDSYFTYQFPKIFLLLFFALFAISPLLYLYARKVFQPNNAPLSLKEKLYFLMPSVVLLVILLRDFIIEDEQLVTMFLSGYFKNAIIIINVASILFTIFYLLKTYKLIKNESLNTSKSAYYFIYALFLITVIITIFFTFSQVINLYFLKTNIDSSLSEYCLNFCWLGLGCYAFVITGFAIIRPEIFSNYAIEETEKPKDELEAIKVKLDDLMLLKKPFLNHDLTLQDLAKMMQSNAHTMSKVINENNANNFYDFVNYHRINEFKKRIESGEHKTKTIIAIANETGFKSKTTFNRTFKKINGITPREYLNTLK